MDGYYPPLNDETRERFVRWLESRHVTGACPACNAAQWHLTAFTLMRPLVGNGFWNPLVRICKGCGLTQLFSIDAPFFPAPELSAEAEERRAREQDRRSETLAREEAKAQRVNNLFERLG